MQVDIRQNNVLVGIVTPVCGGDGSLRLRDLDSCAEIATQDATIYQVCEREGVLVVIHEGREIWIRPRSVTVVQQLNPGVPVLDATVRIVDARDEQ
jgi:hypothetical protein